MSAARLSSRVPIRKDIPMRLKTFFLTVVSAVLTSAVLLAVLYVPIISVKTEVGPVYLVGPGAQCFLYEARPPISRPDNLGCCDN